ncbi:Uncharacterized conserved protein, contains HEPN domain [Bosea lupini]|uniref:Uncharacterized conserved protein, contains HEPN domain n=1 Tax=Bosea lupini TaxID=1036779 RepID=A0A1H7PNY6_9HYPH|nr:DUF86 domain-containing protein [Bosea lupini]SEL37316.1 Uncharacterized conserved protein, contains HEPN domain [Bosea lupini]
MNRHQRLADYLRHMFDAARKSGVYIDGMERADFLADERTQQAVVLNLVIIGEAATKLLQTHADFLDNYADVPWKSMKGMRNRIAHGYFDINLGIVWETARTALPQLVARLPEIIAAAEEKP